MKRLFYIVVLLCLWSCDSEDTNDCFQAAGSMIQETVVVSDFERILVNRDVELILKYGESYEVVIETGENLISDVTAEVVGNQLILTDNNTCNFVRDFGITKVYVTAPNLSEIRCSTQFDMSSDGVLPYDNLRLLSENFNAPNTFPIGDFRLQLNAERIDVVSNGLSFFYLSGEVTTLNINFASGESRFEGENLIAQNIDLFHRGTNDMVVNPQQSISGRIVSNGNVIAVNEPPEVTVEKLFNGRLIFK